MRRRWQSPLFRAGWNVALQTVVRSMEQLPKSLMAELNGSDALEAIGAVVTVIAAPPARCFATNRALARKYGVSRWTITNWRKEGCPFHESPRKVLDWISRRRYAPKGTETKFKDQLSDRRIRYLLAQTKVGFAEIRAVKELHKFYGIEPDGWLKRFRCPKNGAQDPRVRALKEQFEKECAG